MFYPRLTLLDGTGEVNALNEFGYLFYTGQYSHHTARYRYLPETLPILIITRQACSGFCNILYATINSTLYYTDYTQV